MKLALVGVGQAGGKIVDAFLRYRDQTRGNFIASASAINTARSDLAGLDRIPDEQRTLIGGARIKGHGVGADNELGAEIALGHRQEVLGALDGIPAGEIDAFLVVAALGGGTGSGAGPVIAGYLKEIYTEPVYGLGILPGANEGGIYTLNAARSFKTFVDEVDNLLLFDNDAWRKSGKTLADSYDELNREIARRFGLLFDAGEVQDGDEVGETIVDASEIINTLDVGGVSTVGYATQMVERPGLLARLFKRTPSVDDTADANRIASLVRRATLGRLTLPCEVQSAERALTVVTGPQSYLSRRGIEHARGWLETETGSMEVRGGDYPLGGDTVAAVVLLSGVSDVPQIQQLQRLALETQDAIEIIDENHDQQLQDLLRDTEDKLEPLY